LDAAHKTGRSWRLGHNNAEDGYLMRKDLHALYDAKLMTIDEKRMVWIDEAVQTHYPNLNGSRLKKAVVIT
jgi:hypothetical protein